MQVVHFDELKNIADVIALFIGITFIVYCFLLSGYKISIILAVMFDISTILN